MKFFLVLILVAIIALLVTNPSQDAYVDWFTDKAVDMVTSEAKNGLGDTWGSIVGGALDYEANRFKNQIASAIKSSTEAKDYKLFSIYTTNFFGNEFVVLGIFKSFIPMQALQEFLSELRIT